MGDVVGRASNRKKAQRQAGHSSRQARQASRAATTQQVATQQVMNQLPDGLDALVQLAKERAERNRATLRAWYRGTEPVAAETPAWPEGSLGYRFIAGTYMGMEAQDAPSLLTARIPAAATIAADPAHRNIATSALVRAVIFDGLTLDHPAVSRLLEVLAPIAEAELDRDFDEPAFPDLDGPVHTLGARALVDAVWAAVGEDPLADVRSVLLPVLDDAVPGLAGQAAAGALIGALAEHYRYDRPGDAEVLQRIEFHSGDALENLVAAGAVPPGDILRVGLTLLSAIAKLCQSDEASLH